MQLDHANSFSLSKDKLEISRPGIPALKRKSPSTIIGLKPEKTEKRLSFQTQRLFNHGLPLIKENPEPLPIVEETQLDDLSMDIRDVAMQHEKDKLVALKPQIPSSLRQFLIQRRPSKAPQLVLNRTLDVEIQKIKLSSNDRMQSVDGEWSDFSPRKTTDKPFSLSNDAKPSVDSAKSPKSKHSRRNTRDYDLSRARATPQNKRSLGIEVEPKSFDDVGRTATHYLSKTATKGLQIPGNFITYSRATRPRDMLTDKFNLLSRSIDESVDNKQYEDLLKTFSHSINSEFKTIFKQIEKTARGTPK